MKQLSSLLWKEWREVRIFLAIGLFVFLGLPLIGGIENYGNRLEILASFWVFMLGGLMAVIIAVGVVVRDLDGRLEEFWRSRPVSTARWLLVKYFVGLLVVLVALGAPLIVESLVNRKTGSFADPRLMLKFHPFLWAALYSLSFAIASVLRRGAHAAMFSIAVMLLLYFLPSVFPPIRFLSLDYVMDTDRVSAGVWIGFAAGMIALSAIGLLISLTAVRRDWRIESDRKLIYWSIGGALLILFSSAAFRVAANMPLLDQVKLGDYEQVARIFSDGSDGIVLTHAVRFRSLREASTQPFMPGSFIHKLHIGATNIELGPAIEYSEFVSAYSAVWLPEHPQTLYFPSEYFNQETQERYPKLMTVSLRDGTATIDIQSFPDQMARDWRKEPFELRLYARSDRLYLFGPKLMTFDISESAKPRLISVGPYSRPPMRGDGGDWDLWGPPSGASSTSASEPETVIMPLPPIPDVPAEERLKMRFQNSWAHLDGDTLAPGFSDSDHVTTYHLDKLTDALAVFRKFGRYDPTPVEQLFGGMRRAETAARDGLLFASGYNAAGGSGSLTAFDINGAHPRPVGHLAFAHDAIYQLHPVTGHRLLAVGSNSLYLIGPPPGQK